MTADDAWVHLAAAAYTARLLGAKDSTDKSNSVIHASLDADRLLGEWTERFLGEDDAPEQS